MKGLFQKNEFLRFCVAGGIATILNYSVFFFLFQLLGVGYLASSAAGYLSGVALGFAINIKHTFKAESGNPFLQGAKYIGVYLFSLALGLVLLSLLVSIGVDALVGNAFSIVLTTITNYFGSKIIVFGKEKSPGEIKGGTRENLLWLAGNPVFLFGLFAKMALGSVFVSSIPADYFIPFLSSFGANPLGNPYQTFLESGLTKAFPYPPMMLFISGLPFLLSGWIGGGGLGFFSLFLLRLPLLFSDIAILAVLCKWLPKRKNDLVALYWLSPVIIYASYIHGQLDIIPISLLFVSMALLFSDRILLGSAVLGLGLATKTHLFLVVPFFLAYLWKRKFIGNAKETFISAVVTLATYAAMLVPYAAGPGMWKLVFGAQEQFRVFDLAINFHDGLSFYAVIAVYLYFVFKALSFRRITKRILVMLAGVTFTLFVTLVRPAQGWYVWCLPFVAYFFSDNSRRGRVIYWSFSFLYLAYFALVPDSDIFSVFRLVSPAVASLAVPFSLLGGNAPVVLSIAFTFLSANLLYVSYLMQRDGIKRDYSFQQADGSVVIGLSGDSGSGKTTLAALLGKMFSFAGTTMVCGDDVHKWERGDPHWEKYTHLNPAGNRIHSHYSQISALKRGEPVLRATYDHGTGRFADPVRINPQAYIIDEGLHTFMVANSDIYTLRIYMDPDPSLKHYWKIERDVRERGQSRAKVLALMKRRKPDAEKYISPQREFADLVVSLFPAEPFEKSFAKGKSPELGATITARSDLAIEPLVEALFKNTSLEICFDYPTAFHQRVSVKGNVSAREIWQALSSLEETDVSEYGLREENICGGIDGVVQAFSFYCMHLRLFEKGTRFG